MPPGKLVGVCPWRSGTDSWRDPGCRDRDPDCGSAPAGGRPDSVHPLPSVPAGRPEVARLGCPTQAEDRDAFGHRAGGSSQTRSAPIFSMGECTSDAPHRRGDHRGTASCLAHIPRQDRVSISVLFFGGSIPSGLTAPDDMAAPALHVFPARIRWGGTRGAPELYRPQTAFGEGTRV